MNGTAASPLSFRNKRRILLVDDHPITRSGLAGVINQQLDLGVCCEACGASDGLRKLQTGVLPDLVITDISLDGKSGLELLRDIRALHPKLPVLVLSMHDETIYAERALRAGAQGYVMKKSGAEVILVAIRKVLSGKTYVSENMASSFIERFSGKSPAQTNSEINILTDREFEVFKLIGEGCSSLEVAVRLHLSPKTVDVYRQHIREKFGLGDSLALIQRAVRWVESQNRT